VDEGAGVAARARRGTVAEAQEAAAAAVAASETSYALQGRPLLEVRRVQPLLVAVGAVAGRRREDAVTPVADAHGALPWRRLALVEVGCVPRAWQRSLRLFASCWRAARSRTPSTTRRRPRSGASTPRRRRAGRRSGRRRRCSAPTKQLAEAEAAAAAQAEEEAAAAAAAAAAAEAVHVWWQQQQQQQQQ
jgi:hypothetical protein